MTAPCWMLADPSWSKRGGKVECLHQELCPLALSLTGCLNHHPGSSISSSANWRQWYKSLLTVALEKTLESPLDCKEIKSVNPKVNQPWIFTGRTDAEAEAPILRPPDAKSRLIGKDPDAGKDWRQKEKGTTEDEMVGWHYKLDGHEFEQTPGESEGQGRVVCCSSWGHQELDTT